MALVLVNGKWEDDGKGIGGGNSEEDSPRFGGGSGGGWGDNFNKPPVDPFLDIKGAYGKGHETLTSGFGKAHDALVSGNDAATAAAKTGFGGAITGFRGDQGKAVDIAQKGADAAKASYNNPNMVTTRAELYQRLLGNGGMDANTVNSMKAGAREEYGTSLRDAQNSLQGYLGGSGASGLAGENLARAASDLGAKRANTTRDIDLANAKMKEDQQSAAIDSSMKDSTTGAGLDLQSAQMVSGLQEKLATGSASLTSDETQLLSKLADEKGTTLAELEVKLAAGDTALTTELGRAIEEIKSNKNTNDAISSSSNNKFLGIF